MDKLPIELVYLILEYQGYHRLLRNGKYIRRLCIDNDKYNIPVAKLNKNNEYIVTLSSKMVNGSLIKYTISTSVRDNKVHWYMERMWYYEKTCDRKRWKKPYVCNYHYVLENNSRQYLEATTF